MIYNTSSLSARRAWIEILSDTSDVDAATVALRKESVDRNQQSRTTAFSMYVALRKESVDRNFNAFGVRYRHISRSPQGERG